MADLTLLNDIIFKIVFGTEANQPLLRALLNALLGLTGKDRIIELEILNPHLDRDYALQKGVILDVKARDDRGVQYNVEVQVAPEPAYVERALYYLTRLFSGQLEPGDPYSRIARTIGISLLDFALFPDLEDLHSTYRMYDERHARELSNVLELHFIELVKFRRDKPHDLRTPFEKWLHVLKFAELYDDSAGDVPAPLREEEGIEMALDRMRKARASDEVRELMELRLKAGHDEATRLERALMEGQRETLKATAIKMRAEGIDDEAIRRITGLGPEDLK